MSENNFQHKPHGNNKQTNKSYKSSNKDKQFKTKAEEFKKPFQANFNQRRDDRLNRSNQLRKNKMEMILNKKRGLIDKDVNISLNSSSMNKTNLSSLIDHTFLNVPPKQCVLVALNAEADLDLIMKTTFNSLTSTASTTGNESGGSPFYTIDDLLFTSVVPLNIFKGKERLSFIKSKRDIYNILDLTKVCDNIIFVSSCKKAEYSKWKEDPDKYAHCIDDFGYEILSILRAQGLPDHICIVQDLAEIPEKHKTDIKKLYSRYFESELKPQKIFSYNNEDDVKSVIRHLCSMNNVHTHLELRKHRSYLLSEKININANANVTTQAEKTVDLEIYGYIRGNTLIPKTFVHITGLGDYLLDSYEIVDDPCPVAYNNRNIGKTRGNSMDVDQQMNKENVSMSSSKLAEMNKDETVEVVIKGMNPNQPKLIDSEFKRM